MNNIYVDELPKRCSDCVCWDYSYDCNLLDEKDFDWNGENLKHTKCPLKLLSDRLAEERRKVVQKILSDFNRKVDDEFGDNDMKYITLDIEEVNFYLQDQVERGE